MQIVIDIPEYIYKLCQGHGDIVYKYIANGTPLPKEHGAIVDLKQIIRIEIEETRTGKKMVWNNNSKIKDTTLCMVTPTIIEADKRK